MNTLLEKVKANLILGHSVDDEPLVAVYTPEVANLLVNVQSSGTVSVNTVDNLFRKNMMNVKPQYKKNPNPGIFDRDYDSYCSLIEWDEFIKNIGKYIEIASQKRDAIYKYDITKKALRCTHSSENAPCINHSVQCQSIQTRTFYRLVKRSGLLFFSMIMRSQRNRWRYGF